MSGHYLARLGLDRQAPTVDYLFALHRAQVERVPYENLEIMLGRPTTVDPEESIGRIAAGRGGYCYHLNGAFATLLRDLGFEVGLHAGGVHGHEDPPGITDNHVVLTVAGLPSAQCPDGVWFVDAGLGDALHEPLPLRAGEFRQGPFTYRLDPSTVVEPGWHFTHAEGGSFAGMDFGLAQVPGIGHFAPAHAALSGPGGTFTRMTVAQRRDAAGVDIVRDALLTRWDGDGKSVRRLGDVDEWRAVWGDLFGVALTPAEVEQLWPEAVRRTEEWLAKQAAERA